MVSAIVAQVFVLEKSVVYETEGPVSEESVAPEVEMEDGRPVPIAFVIEPSIPTQSFYRVYPTFGLTLYYARLPSTKSSFFLLLYLIIQFNYVSNSSSGLIYAMRLILRGLNLSGI